MSLRPALAAQKPWLVASATGSHCTGDVSCCALALVTYWYDLSIDVLAVKAVSAPVYFADLVPEFTEPASNIDDIYVSVLLSFWGPNRERLRLITAH